MAEPYLGEIRLFSYNFAPKAWAFCDGGALNINQNKNLYRLISTTYGGDGVNNFRLPNLQGRTGIHQGVEIIGSNGGKSTQSLSMEQMPRHNHTMTFTSSVSTLDTPIGGTPAVAAAVVGAIYAPGPGLSAMAPVAIQTVGGAPHNNMQPYLTLNFCIALDGIYPERP